MASISAQPVVDSAWIMHDLLYLVIPAFILRCLVPRAVPMNSVLYFHISIVQKGI